jgi:hypothetical protein
MVMDVEERPALLVQEERLDNCVMLHSLLIQSFFPFDFVFFMRKMTLCTIIMARNMFLIVSEM